MNISNEFKCTNFEKYPIYKIIENLIFWEGVQKNSVLILLLLLICLTKTLLCKFYKKHQKNLNIVREVEYFAS